MSEPAQQAINDWNTEAQEAESYEQKISKQEDIERASIDINDIKVSTDYLSAIEQEELAKAYRDESWLDIGHFHMIAIDRYVKKWAEHKVSRQEGL